jgi:hypothetical protein
MEGGWPSPSQTATIKRGLRPGQHSWRERRTSCPSLRATRTLLCGMQFANVFPPTLSGRRRDPGRPSLERKGLRKGGG